MLVQHPRDNKNLNEHVHSCNENSYPSGNMQLSKFETVTNYRAPRIIQMV